MAVGAGPRGMVPGERGMATGNASRTAGARAMARGRAGMAPLDGVVRAGVVEVSGVEGREAAAAEHALLDGAGVGRVKVGPPAASWMAPGLATLTGPDVAPAIRGSGRATAGCNFGVVPLGWWDTALRPSAGWLFNTLAAVAAGCAAGSWGAPGASWCCRGVVAPRSMGRVCAGSSCGSRVRPPLLQLPPAFDLEGLEAGWHAPTGAPLAGTGEEDGAAVAAAAGDAAVALALALAVLSTRHGRRSKGQPGGLEGHAGADC